MPINDKKNLTSQGCLGDKAWVMMGNDQFDSHKESIVIFIENATFYERRV